METRQSVVTPERFARGMSFDQYVAYVGTPENLKREGSQGAARRDWSGYLRKAYESARLTDAQAAAIRWLAAQPNGPAKVLMIAEEWSSDCRRDLPMLARLAEAGGMELRIFRRDGQRFSRSQTPSLAEAPDSNAELMAEFLNVKNGQSWQSIPVVVFYTKALEYLCRYVEYPAIYHKDRVVGHLRAPRPGGAGRRPPWCRARVLRGNGPRRPRAPAGRPGRSGGERPDRPWADRAVPPPDARRRPRRRVRRRPGAGAPLRPPRGGRARPLRDAAGTARARRAVRARAEARGDRRPGDGASNLDGRSFSDAAAGIRDRDGPRGHAGGRARARRRRGDADRRGDRARDAARADRHLRGRGALRAPAPDRRGMGDGRHPLGRAARLRARARLPAQGVPRIRRLDGADARAVRRVPGGHSARVDRGTRDVRGRVLHRARRPGPAETPAEAAPALLDGGGLPRHLYAGRAKGLQDPDRALLHAVGHPPEELRRLPGGVARDPRDRRGRRHRDEQDHPRRRHLEAGAGRSQRADAVVLSHPGRPHRRFRRRPARAVQVLQTRARESARALRRAGARAGGDLRRPRRGRRQDPPAPRGPRPHIPHGIVQSRRRPPRPDRQVHAPVRRKGDATVRMSPLTLDDVTVSRVIELDRSSFPTLSMLPDATPDVIARHHHWLRPRFWDDRTGDLGSRIGTYVVRTPRHTVLIDTGIGNDKPRDGSPAWHMRRGSYLDDLRAPCVRRGPRRLRRPDSGRAFPDGGLHRPRGRRLPLRSRGVDAAGRILEVVGVARGDVVHGESRRLQVVAHLVGLEERGGDRDLLAEPVLRVNVARAPVKRDQQPAARNEDARQLAEGARDRVACEVDQRVEGDDPREGRVGERQGQHVALLEGDPGIAAPRQLDHPGREVEAEDVDAARREITPDVGGPAAHVPHPAAAGDRRREAIEPGAVEGLLLQLVEEGRRVLLGDAVVLRREVGLTGILAHRARASRRGPVSGRATGAPPRAARPGGRASPHPRRARRAGRRRAGRWRNARAGGRSPAGRSS